MLRAIASNKYFSESNILRFQFVLQCFNVKFGRFKEHRLFDKTFFNDIIGCYSFKSALKSHFGIQRVLNILFNFIKHWQSAKPHIYYHIINTIYMTIIPQTHFITFYYNTYASTILPNQILNRKLRRSRCSHCGHRNRFRLGTTTNGHRLRSVPVR